MKPLKLLEESGLISRRTGAIMLLPKVAHRGSDRREAYPDAEVPSSSTMASRPKSRTRLQGALNAERMKED